MAKTKRYNMVSAKEIVGKRIIGFESRPFDAGRVGYKQMVHNPKIILDDNSVLIFIAEMGETSEGVKILRVKLEKK